MLHARPFSPCVTATAPCCRRRPGHPRATIVKHGARKIRRLYNDQVLAGFAGSAADSFALFSRFEAKLEQYRGNLERSAVELAKDWRTDRALRRLEAMLVVLDQKSPSSCPAPAT